MPRPPRMDARTGGRGRRGERRPGLEKGTPYPPLRYLRHLPPTLLTCRRSQSQSQCYAVRDQSPLSAADTQIPSCFFPRLCSSVLFTLACVPCFAPNGVELLLRSPLGACPLLYFGVKTAVFPAVSTLMLDVGGEVGVMPRCVDGGPRFPVNDLEFGNSRRGSCRCLQSPPSEFVAYDASL